MVITASASAAPIAVRACGSRTQTSRQGWAKRAQSDVCRLARDRPRRNCAMLITAYFARTGAPRHDVVAWNTFGGRTLLASASSRPG